MSVNILLSCFFRNCKKQFDFLKTDFGFSSIAGMASYERGHLIIDPNICYETASYPFYAHVRYESDDIFFEVSYGDYNYALECTITYRRYQKFLLSDLIMLLPSLPSNTPICYYQKEHPHPAPQAHHVQSLLRTASASLRACSDFLLNDPGDDYLERVMTHKDERMQRVKQDLYLKRKHHDCEKAANAFQEQDFKRAIMLYRPYKNDLSAIETRMLSLAISYLDQ